VILSGDHRDHRDLSTQRELHESVVVSELDTVAFGPGPARLVVPTWVDEDEGTLRQGGFGLLMSGRYRPEPPQDPFDPRKGKRRS